MACYGQHAARIRLDCTLDLTSRIQFGSVLSKKALIILCKTSPDLIWMTWSAFGQIHLVQKQADVQESLGPVLAEYNWPATSFPLSDLAAFFDRWPRSHCAKPAQIWFGSGWLCQVLAKWIQSRRKPVVKNHQTYFWLMLLSQCGSDTNWIQHVYWDNSMK